MTRRKLKTLKLKKKQKIPQSSQNEFTLRRGSDQVNCFFSSQWGRFM